MKNKIIKTIKGEFIVIDMDTLSKDIIAQAVINSINNFKGIIIGDNMYEEVGSIINITEEQAKEVVDESPRTDLFAHYVNGVNPPNIYQYSSAIPSLRSLLGVNGVLFNNTFGDRSKVWNKQQTYLFKKI